MSTYYTVGTMPEALFRFTVEGKAHAEARKEAASPGGLEVGVYRHEDGQKTCVAVYRRQGGSVLKLAPRTVSV